MSKRWYIAPTLAAAVPPLAVLINGFRTGDFEGTLGTLEGLYTGYDFINGEWTPDLALANYGGIFAASMISKAMSGFGLNRRLPKGFNI